MMVIPAVDIMGGKVTRLTKGDPDTKKEYNDFGDPPSFVRYWEKQGAQWIHVIDLDAALGRGDNTSTIKEILRETEVPCLIGGGLRSLEAAKGILEAGAGRIIIGSMAIRNPETVKTLIGEYGSDRIVVSLDRTGGDVFIDGWETKAGLSLGKAMAIFKGLGVGRFLVTSVDRDGTLSGPDLKVYEKLSVRAHVIAAGGIGTLKDIADLRETGVESAVVGKALYEERFTLPQAILAANGGKINGLS